MTPLQRRVALFLVGCMGVRGLLVYAAATVPPTWLRWMAVPAAGVALGFAVIYAAGLRRTGLETGGAPIWWDALRPVHAAVYALVAYCAWTGRRGAAWKLLLADLALGLASFSVFHLS